MASSAQGAVDSLLGRLSSVLLEEAKLLHSVRGDVEFIKDEMMNMNGFLLDLADVKRPSHQADAWAKQVKELAYDSQNCIDHYMQCVGIPGSHGGLLATTRRAPRMLHTLLARHRIAMRIKELKARARDLGDRRVWYDVTVSPTDRISATAAMAKEEDGTWRRQALENATDFLNDDIRKVIGWLTKKLPDKHPQSQQRLRVIAIVRRQYQEDEYPLARKVFEHPSLRSSFQLKAWINGVDKYTKPQATLQSILEQLLGGNHHQAKSMDEKKLHGGNHTQEHDVDDKKLHGGKHDQAEDMDEKKLVEKLRDHLKGKRFLIVAANDPYGLVRTQIESACHLLADADVNPFPSGSAIMVTTWLTPREPSAFYEIKDYLCIDDTVFYKTAVTLLNGWCDKDRKEILRKILIRRGWNFFSMEMFVRALYVNPNRSTEELHNLLGSSTPPMIATEIMRYCYNDLPSHYKSCLLYLSILFKSMYEESSSTQDFKVKRTSIVRRWAAEDLISKRDDRVATDEAERCFDDLVVRGLVCPVDIGAAGRVKSCTVHHRVLSFITNVARDEGLVEDDKDLTPDLACRLSIRNGISLEKCQPQLPKKKNLWVIGQQSTACCKPLPTSIDLEESPMDSEESKHYAEVDKTQEFLESLPTSYLLEFVKVLDLEGFKQLKRHHLKDVCNKMFHLKYLSIRNTDVSELPSDIEKLRYLETLDIRQTRIQTFTTKAIVLPKLVHLLAGGYVQKSGAGRSFLTVRLPREIGSMVDLQILYHVVSKSADELMEVGRLQQLRKLGVVLHGKEVRLSHFLRVIERLNECLRSLSVKFELASSETPDLNMGNMAFSPPKLLESLNINGNITGLPSWIKNLRQLVKVTLCGTSLMNNAIRMLGGLSSLRCLRLLHKSYIEMRLTFMDGEFPNLKYLIVEGSVISTIHFGNGAASKLEKIVWAFEKMVSLSGIEGLPCLKEIELNGACNPCKIIEALAEHPNHPVVIHKSVNETLVP